MQIKRESAGLIDRRDFERIARGKKNLCAPVQKILDMDILRRRENKGCAA
ncbi:MAG: hypothetical protein R3D66_03040 [Alphaproteobacteria bacterium]